MILSGHTPNPTSARRSFALRALPKSHYYEAVRLWLTRRYVRPAQRARFRIRFDGDQHNRVVGAVSRFVKYWWCVGRSDDSSHSQSEGFWNTMPGTAHRTVPALTAAGGAVFRPNGTFAAFIGAHGLVLECWAAPKIFCPRNNPRSILRPLSWRSFVAMASGERLSREDARRQRPGTGEIKAVHFASLLGKPARPAICLNVQLRSQNMG